MLPSEIGCLRKISEQLEYIYMMLDNDTAKELFNSQSLTLRHLTRYCIAKIKLHWVFNTVNAGKLSGKSNLGWKGPVGSLFQWPAQSRSSPGEFWLSLGMEDPIASPGLYSNVWPPSLWTIYSKFPCCNLCLLPLILLLSLHKEPGSIFSDNSSTETTSP